MNDWADRARVWGKRHPRWTAGASVLLAVIVGFGAFYLQLPHTSSSRPLAARDATARPTATAAPPTATPMHFTRPELQAGVAFPRWDVGAYGARDTDWRQGLVMLQQQTGARWVSIVVNLYQDTFQSTTIHAGTGTPSLQTLEQGITYAHSLNLKVFVEPLLTVIEQPQWDGLIYFSSYDQAQAWFDGYWSGYEPYVRAAAEAGADELGVATELQALEQQPAALWNTLIAHARAAFPGALTYNINWNSLIRNGRLLTIPSWMRNSALDFLGVSEYQPITESPRSLSTDDILGVWRQQLLPVLDNLSQTTGKQVILSEIGYRNATDALSRPWDHTTSAAADPSLQAAAYTAATHAVFADRHVAGLFFWAWENGVFAPSPATCTALRTQYLSAAA
jgi:hypothetical protein